MIIYQFRFSKDKTIIAWGYSEEEARQDVMQYMEEAGMPVVELELVSTTDSSRSNIIYCEVD